MIENHDGSITYNQDDLQSMTQKERNNVFLHKVKIKGTGVVRDASGNVKYDDPAKVGNYGEQL